MIPKICALALLSALLSVVLSDLGFKSKRQFSVLCLLLIFSALAENVFSVISRVTEIANVAGISEAAKCAVKAVGAGYIFGFTSEVCAELGENRIASTVILVGRIEIFLLVLPYFEKTVSLGLELLQ